MYMQQQQPLPKHMARPAAGVLACCRHGAAQMALHMHAQRALTHSRTHGKHDRLMRNPGYCRVLGYLLP